MSWLGNPGRSRIIVPRQATAVGATYFDINNLDCTKHRYTIRIDWGPGLHWAGDWRLLPNKASSGAWTAVETGASAPQTTETLLVAIFGENVSGNVHQATVEIAQTVDGAVPFAKFSVEVGASWSGTGLKTAKGYMFATPVTSFRLASSAAFTQVTVSVTEHTDW